MIYVMNVSWFYPFTFLLLIHKVSMQSHHVKSAEGDTVVLPCLISQKSQVVFWQYGDHGTVCEITVGAKVCNGQDPVYKDRVAFSPSEIEKGNFSISLKNVMKSDEGNYNCNAPNLSKLNVELTVKDRDEKRISPTSPASKNSKSTRQADGLLTFLLGCALLYSLTY